MISGVLSGARWAAVQGGLVGAARGFVRPYVCFVAGTRVVVGVEDDEGNDLLRAAGGSILAETTLDGEHAVATLPRVRYATVAIEDLVARGGGERGDGGGQRVAARDQHDPSGPLTLCRVSRTYERIAYRLQVPTLRDPDGIEQTLRVTEEHPFHRAGGGGWTPAKALVPGDKVLGGTGTLAVVANVVEERPEGVKVYNLEVQGAHTYFVLGADAAEDADAAWVHNASYEGANPASKAAGEKFTARAQDWWDKLPGVKRYGATVAVSEAEGREVVSLYANIGKGKRQFAQHEVTDFLRSVEDAGGIAIHTSGTVHAEVTLHSRYPGAPAIGISNPYGPCLMCGRYFDRTSYSNVYWPDR